MLVLFCMRGCGRIERPAFPAPSVTGGQDVQVKLARKPRRDRETVSVHGGLFEMSSRTAVIARSASDEAIQKPSFRGDAEHRTRNLEIPGLVLAHHPGMTEPEGRFAPRNDGPQADTARPNPLPAKSGERRKDRVTPP